LKLRLCMQSTAVYPNRITDKQKLEATLGLEEFGDNRTCFQYQVLIAQGYNRIVYGDHGPYVEFEEHHFKRPLVSHFGQHIAKELPLETDVNFYYYWLEPEGVPQVKVYWQIKPVTNLKNAPYRSDRLPSKFNRVEGYADYRRGLYYVSPYSFMSIDRVR
jgi:hypothetical protein